MCKVCKAVQVVFSYYNIAFELYTGFHLTFHKKPQISSGFAKWYLKRGICHQAKRKLIFGWVSLPDVSASYMQINEVIRVVTECSEYKK